MKNRFIWGTPALVLAVTIIIVLASNSARAASPPSEASTKPTAQKTKTSSISAKLPQNEEPKLLIGLGWPDVRLKTNLAGKLDAELKVAFSSGAMAYGGRLYWRPLAFGSLEPVVGGGGGLIAFSDLEGESGSGSYFEGFGGLQYTFLQHWKVLADCGPTWVQLNSKNESVSEQHWVFNIALYYVIF
jgi:hypothetical protein